MYAQLINSDLNGRGISDLMADKAMITMGSELEEAAIFPEREVLMLNITRVLTYVYSLT